MLFLYSFICFIALGFKIKKKMSSTENPKERVKTQSNSTEPPQSATEPPQSATEPPQSATEPVGSEAQESNGAAVPEETKELNRGQRSLEELTIETLQRGKNYSRLNRQLLSM
jgi:hypothetical protein